MSTEGILIGILALVITSTLVMLPVTVGVTRVIIRERPKYDTWRLVTASLIGWLVVAGWIWFAFRVDQPLIAAIFGVSFIATKLVNVAAKA